MIFRKKSIPFFNFFALSPNFHQKHTPEAACFRILVVFFGQMAGKCQATDGQMSGN